MTISTIRRATQNDIEDLNVEWIEFRTQYKAAAVFFGDEPGSIEPHAYCEDECDQLRTQWQFIAHRTLGLPTTGIDVEHPVVISYGVIGRAGY